ncbi:hypothetical protein MKW98_031036 [Papaver atlanticum]|nr:hypothetical protein MKW98_031036 [Papaver atlanticum]
MVLEKLMKNERSTADFDEISEQLVDDHDFVKFLRAKLQYEHDKMKKRVNDRLQILQMTTKAQCAIKLVNRFFNTRKRSCKRKRRGGSSYKTEKLHRRRKVKGSRYC